MTDLLSTQKTAAHYVPRHLIHLLTNIFSAIITLSKYSQLIPDHSLPIAAKIIAVVCVIVKSTVL